MMVLLILLDAWADTCDYGPEEWVTSVAVSAAESSGLAASHTWPGRWFTHDDKGGMPRLYVFDETGADYAPHPVPGVEMVDWEDLAPGPCPDGGDCLYIGDIGDNDVERLTIGITIVREPTEEGAPAEIVERWALAWPDGPRDAETLLVHPCTGQVYLATRPQEGPTEVHRVAPTAQTLELLTTLDLPDAPTGGAFDADGDRLVLRSDTYIWAWSVDPADPEAAFFEPPQELETSELPNSEAIAFAPDGAIWSTAEGLPMPVVRFPCSEHVPSDHRCEAPVHKSRDDAEPQRCGCTIGAAPAAWVWFIGLALVRRQGGVSRAQVRECDPRPLE